VRFESPGGRAGGSPILAARMSPGVRFMCLVIGVLGGACVGDHDFDDDHDGFEHGGTDSGDEHDTRDPATEPCDASNWSELFPDLRECDLAGEVLDGASLRRADLSDAMLAGASLRGADLFTAVLARSIASDADLAGAKLTAADLTAADLTGASLVGAVLIQADLTGATLEGTTTDETTTCPDGDPGPCW
jgi:hypothetical protein